MRLALAEALAGLEAVSALAAGAEAAGLEAVSALAAADAGDVGVAAEAESAGGFTGGVFPAAAGAELPFAGC
ncbi:MAG: hypothetical protein ACREQD_17080 [Candidatus Binataceae bacterium]